MENNNFNMPGEYPQAWVSAPKLRDFTGVEIAYAWICLALGFLFWKAFPVIKYPLGFLIFVTVLIVSTIVIVKLRGCKLTVKKLVPAIVSFVFALSLLFATNYIVQIFIAALCLFLNSYFVHIAFENNTEDVFGDYILMDFLKACFIAPFLSFSELFFGAFSSKQGKSKLILKLLIGVGIALIPTTLIVVLLSYDYNFSRIIEKIFDVEIILENIACALLGVPVAMLFYGNFISSTDKKTTKIMDAKGCKATYKKVKIAPVSTVLAATVPILAVYVIFFISQWEYYVSAFKGILPEETIYSEYAREGFFQLCIVALINFAIILAVTALTKRKFESPVVAQKILTSVFSVFTLVLIATALSKMCIYIDAYGLTQKRVYASWLMIVLAILFVIIIVKQFISKLKAIAVSVLVILVSFGAIAFCNVEGVIADYNVEGYISGEISEIDVVELDSLGDAAVPAMVKLSEYYESLGFNDEPVVGTSNAYYRLLKMNLEAKAEEYEKSDSVWEITIPKVKAEKLLKP